MSDPYIQVKGKGNRVAGRDYHEHHYPELCPYCEIRYLTRGRNYCRHCEVMFERARQQRLIVERQKKRKKTADRISVLLSLLAFIGLVFNWYGPEIVHNIALAVSSISVLCAAIIIRFFGR